MGDGAGGAGYVTLLPTADVSGARNITGTTPLTNQINDNSDSTFVRMGTAGQGYPNIWFATVMGDLAVTVDGTSKKINRLRCRARIGRQSADAGHWQKASLTVRTTTPSISPSGPRDVCQTASVGPLAFTGAWRPADPFGKPWTQSTVNGVQMEAYGYVNQVGSSALTAFLVFYEWYLDVDIRERPTITGTPTITGASTTRPQVDFVYAANPDGDPMARGQVKVFTAAQYGAGGFSADTSASYWDSGELPTASTSFKVGRDLANGITYKAYCRAAQLINGAVWWTTWVPSSAFTVSLGPPADPTLTVTADEANQRAVLTVAANQNVLSAQDSDFEDAAGGTGTWTVLVNCAAVRSTTKSVSPGAASMRLTATATADMSATLASPVSPVVAGRTYTFYAQFAAGTTTRTCRVEVDWLDAAGTIIGSTVNGSGVTDSAANFNATSTLTAAAPAGARTVKVRVRVLVPAAAEIHYVDHVGMWPGSAATWTSGGQQSVSTVLLETLDAAASSLNLLQNQVATCGATEHSAAGFYGRAASDGVVFDDSTGQDTGEGSIRWTSGISFSNLDLGINQNALTLFDPSYAFPVVPGKSYTFTLSLKASASFSSKLFLMWHGPTGTALSSSNVSMTITTGFVRYTVTATAPAGAMWAGGSVENTASVSGVQVWASRAMLRENGTATDAWVPGQLVEAEWRTYPGWADKTLGGDEAQEETVYDYTLPRGRSRQYRVRVINSVTGTAVASTSYAYGAAEVSNAGGWYLVDPYHPWLSLRILTPDLTLDTSENAQVYQLQGRDRAVVLADSVFGDDGTVTFTSLTRDEGLRLLALSREQHALLLRSPFADEQWWVRFTERAREFEGGTDATVPVRQWRIRYYEVDQPA
jgi:hypothetical protein